LALLPLATLFHKLDALETLEDAALGANGTGAGFETGMLGHGEKKVCGIFEERGVKGPDADVQRKNRPLPAGETMLSPPVPAMPGFP
jgi:hypothetical protein